MPDKTEEKTPREVLAEEEADQPGVDRRDATEEEEEDLRPIADPEVAAQMAKARDMGITGDPDAPPGYFVDENHRPNPLDVGTIITTEYHGVSSYDVASYSGAIANAGADPFEGVEVPESPEPPPQMGATDYDPTLKAGVPSEEAMAAHQESMVQQAELAEAQAEATQAQQEAIDAQTGEVVAVTEEEAPEKAQGATKAAPHKQAAAPHVAGTKDTALEKDPKK
jgi:hypothetical protein